MHEFQAIELQLATPATQPPAGEGWLHEVKYDGYRIAAKILNGRVSLHTRSGLDWTDRFVGIASALSRLPVTSAILDGEIIAPDRQGRSSFGRLQAILAGKLSGELHYRVFDLLAVEDQDLRSQPLEARQAALTRLFAGFDEPAVQLTDRLDYPGDEVFRHACRLELEGIVSKRADSPYRPGRGRDWLKTVCVKTGDFVIIGYTEPEGSRRHFGSLLLAEWRDADGTWIYAGKVGTGFTDTELESLHAQLTRLDSGLPAVDRASLPAGVARGVTWVEPRLVIEVAYHTRTESGLLRQARFRRLREDKPVRQAEMAGNEANMAESEVQLAGIRLTNPDRVLYPGQGMTKIDLARYWQELGEEQLRWLMHRPLSLVRCPTGVGGSCFYQKHPGAAFADSLERIMIEEEEGPDEYLVVREHSDLIALVQAGVLEIHTWNSTTADLDHPDQLVFDLDPDGQVPFSRLKEHARDLRDLLREIGLEPFLRVTGGKGLHLLTPIQPDTGWDAVKRFCKTVADSLVARDPERLTANMSKAKRKGRVFIDYLRNARGATAISNWSPRARAGAPVAVPIRWDELSRLDSPAAWSPEAALRRLRSLKEDAWEGFEDARRSLRELVTP